MAVKGNKRAALLTQLKSLGEDPSMMEVSYYLEQLVTKMDSVSLDKINFSEIISEIKSLQDSQEESGSSLMRSVAELLSAVAEVSLNIQGLKPLLGELKPKELNMERVENLLISVKDALKPLENSQYWMKTSDKLTGVEKILQELLKQQKENNQGNLAGELSSGFSELKKQFTEDIDRMIKANRESVTVVGSGRPSRQGLINVAFDSVDVVYPTGTSEVYTFKVGTNSPNGSGNVIAVVTVVYVDSTKNAVLSVRKV